MRRIAAIAAIMLPVMAVACGTAARKYEDAQAVNKLRKAVPSIEAYWVDHNTYAGATLAKLRTDYDPSIADISIVTVREKTYCIEAAYGDSHAFHKGPEGDFMLGSCSDPESGKPYNQSDNSSDKSNASDPTMPLRASVPAIEAYYQDHTAYTGITLPKRRQQYDYGLPDIRVVHAQKETYCIEISVDCESAFKQWPTADIENGTCPT